MLSRNPRGARVARRRGASPGSPRTSRRRPRRSRAATGSSTSPARTSPSGGPTTSSGGSALARARARATWSPGCARPTRAGRAGLRLRRGLLRPARRRARDEDRRPGDDFLAQVCVAWEREAVAAEQLGVRVVRMRTGIVLDRDGGALAKMLPFSSSASAGRWPAGASTCRGSTSTTSSALPRRARRRDWRAPVNGPRPTRSTNKEFSKRARARAAPAGGRARPGFAMRAAVRRDGRRSS